MSDHVVVYNAFLADRHKATWPSGLRRQFKALVFGRGFESRGCHFCIFIHKRNETSISKHLLDGSLYYRAFIIDNLEKSLCIIKKL